MTRRNAPRRHSVRVSAYRPPCLFCAAAHVCRLSPACLYGLCRRSGTTCRFADLFRTKMGNMSHAGGMAWAEGGWRVASVATAHSCVCLLSRTRPAVRTILCGGEGYGVRAGRRIQISGVLSDAGRGRSFIPWLCRARRVSPARASDSVKQTDGAASAWRLAAALMLNRLRRRAEQPASAQQRRAINNSVTSRAAPAAATTTFTYFSVLFAPCL